MGSGVGGVETKIMCVSFFLTRRGIEGGGVIIRHVVRESAVGRPFPVTVVSIINLGVIVVAAVDGAVLVIVLQILTSGLAAIHRRQTAAQNAIKTIVSKKCATTTTTTTTTTTSLLKIFFSPSHSVA